MSLHKHTKFDLLLWILNAIVICVARVTLNTILYSTFHIPNHFTSGQIAQFLHNQKTQSKYPYYDSPFWILLVRAMQLIVKWMAERMDWLLPFDTTINLRIYVQNLIHCAWQSSHFNSTSHNKRKDNFILSMQWANYKIIWNCCCDDGKRIKSTIFRCHKRDHS